RQHAPPGHPRDHVFNVVAVEATERQGADVGKTNPGWLELGSEGEQCQDRQLAHPLDRQIEELEGSGIRPVRILKHEQDRLPASETLELIEQSRERPAALLCGAERQWRLSLAELDRQQRRKKRRYGLNLGCAHGEDRFQLVEALLGGIVCLENCFSLQLGNEPTKRAR